MKEPQIWMWSPFSRSAACKRYIKTQKRNINLHTMPINACASQEIMVNYLWIRVWTSKQLETKTIFIYSHLQPEY